MNEDKLKELEELIADFSTLDGKPMLPSDKFPEWAMRSFPYVPDLINYVRQLEKENKRIVYDNLVDLAGRECIIRMYVRSK